MPIGASGGSGETIELSSLTLLGHGGEARVFACDDERVLRVFNAGTTSAVVSERTRLLEQVAAGSGGLHFEVPVVLDSGELVAQSDDGEPVRHLYTIEKRIAGSSMDRVLETATGQVRNRLIEHYLETASTIREIQLTGTGFGEIGAAGGLLSDSWHEWLGERARQSMSGTPLSSLDPEVVISRLPKCESAALVHLDYFPGNAMAVGDRVTGVIDFGYACVLGDPTLAPCFAAAYLTLGRTKTVAQPDVDVALSWLERADLLGWYEPAAQWLAMYWMMVPVEEDPTCRAWCASILSSLTS